MATNSLGKNIVFPIYKADGTSFEGLVLQKATYDSVVMSLGDKITGDVYYKDNALAVTMQEYIEYKNNPDDQNEEPVKFYLVNPPTIVREGHVSDSGDARGMTKYSFEFYHPMYALGNFPFTDVAVTDSEEQYLSQNKTFSWIGNCYDFINKLNVNLRSTKWFVIANTDEQTDAKMKVLSDVLSFDKNFISEALKTAFDTWEVPFVIDSVQEGEFFDEQGNDYYDSGKRFVIIFGLPSNEIIQKNGDTGTFVEASTLATGKIYYHTAPLSVRAGQKIVLESLTEGAFPVILNDTHKGVIGTSSKTFVEDMTIYIGLSNSAGMVRYFFDGDEGGVFVFKFGQGVGLKNNSRTPRNNKIITRISGYGSETNIPYGYPQIVWYGDKTWNYTINNRSGMQDITIGGKTYRAMSYPIYDGIVGGKRVRLIKHPFTRTHLMPSIYSQTVFNKVSQYMQGLASSEETVYSDEFNALLNDIQTNHIERFANDCEFRAFSDLYNLLVAIAKETPSQTISRSINGEGYTGNVVMNAQKIINGYVNWQGVQSGEEYEIAEDTPIEKTIRVVFNPDFNPSGQIIDYYDAPQSYPNPIVPDSPSFEMHEFEKIKPQLGEAVILDAVPYNINDMDAIVYNTKAEFLTYLSGLINDARNQNENVALINLYYAISNDKKSYSAGTNGGAYTFSCTVSSDGYYYYVKYVSDSINIDAIVLYAEEEPPVQWNDKMNDNGEYEQSYFKIKLPQLSFDLYASAAITQEMKINMRSGACIGCTFPIQVDWEDYKSVFYDDQGNFDPDGKKRQDAIDRYPYSNNGSIEVIVQKEYETFGTLMPNIYQQPKTNDKFVILGISLPLSYITSAESELDEAMMEYMLENNVYYYDYPLKFDEYFLAKNTDILSQMRNNTIIRFMFAGVHNVLYVKQITKKFGDNPLPSYDITLTDDVEIVLNQIGQVTDDVSRMRLQVNELQKYYAQNIDGMVSSKLSRISDDVALGRITFQQGLDAIASVIFYDEVRSPQFESGLLTGRGWRIDGLGNAELESLRVRSYLEVVELLVNRIQAQEGDTMFTDNDQIDMVEEIEYQGTTYYLLSLKEKWDGYFTAQQEGNVIRGIINTLAANAANISDVEASECVETDGKNKYYTSWMLCVDVPSGMDVTLGKNQILTILYGENDTPAKKNFPPCELMTIVRWGCNKNPNEEGITEAEKESRRRRQNSFLISTTEGRLVKLVGVNKPILENGNYGTTLGELPDFVKRYPSVAQRLREGGDYLYAQGIVVGDFIKIDKEGQPIVNYVDRGEWQTNTVYLVNEYNPDTLQYETHDVWHNGSYWRCRMHQPVSNVYYEPVDNSPYWEKLLTSGKDGKDAAPVQPNILIRTIFDNGIDFIKEGWLSQDWNCANVVNTQEQGRKFILVNSTASSTRTYIDLSQNVRSRVSVGQWYTLSFYSKSSNAFDVYIYSGSDEVAVIDRSAGMYVDGIFVESPSINGRVQLNDENVVKYHTITFKTASSFSTMDFNVIFRALKVVDDIYYGTNLYMCMPKLEAGTSATAYMANESDLIGADGESSIRVDLSNQSDIIACDSAGNVRYARTITTQATLYIGSTPITTGVTANSVTIEGVTSSPTNLLYSWTFPKDKKMSSAAYNATITLTYQGESYSTTFKLIRTDAVAVYQVLPSAKAISFAYDNTQLKYVPDSIKVSCGYQKIDANGTTDYVGTVLANLRTSAFGGTAPYNMFYRHQKQDGTWTDWSWSKDLPSDDSYQVTIPNSTTYIAVEFAMSTSTTYRSVSSDNIIDRETIPIVKDGIKGTKGDKGDDGSRGKMGRNIYFAGKLSDVKRKTFNATDHEAPYVDVETGNGDVPNCYVYIGENATNKAYPTTAEEYQSSTEWQIMASDFQYLITKATFADFAKLGSGIFNKDWMFSQYGLSGKVIRNASMTRVSYSSYTLLSNMTDSDYKLRVEAGKEYEVVIQCYSSSGNLYFHVFYNTNGDGTTINYIGNQNISTASTSTVSLHFKFMAEFSGYAFIGCQGNGYVGQITSNTYDDYQNMSPSFVNNDEVKYISGHGANANWEAVTYGSVFYVVAGMAYRLKASMTAVPSSDFVLSAYYADTDEPLGVAYSSLTFNSGGSQYKEADGDFVPSRSGFILFRGYSYGSRQWVEYVTIQPKNNFIPKVVVDWSNGYAHFGGDTIRFNPDGSGFLAGGNVRWDKSGNTNVEGIVTAKMMYGQQLNIPWYAGIGTEVLTAYTIDPENNPANVFVASCTSNSGKRNLTITLPIAGYYEGLELKFLCTCSPSRLLRIKAQGSEVLYFVSEYEGTFGWHYANTIQVKYDTLVVAQSIDGTWYVTQGAVGYSSQ